MDLWMRTAITFQRLKEYFFQPILVWNEKKGYEIGCYFEQFLLKCQCMFILLYLVKREYERKK